MQSGIVAGTGAATDRCSPLRRVEYTTQRVATIGCINQQWQQRLRRKFTAGTQSELESTQRAQTSAKASNLNQK